MYQEFWITVKIEDKVLGVMYRKTKAFFKHRAVLMYTGLFMKPRFE